MTIAFINKTSSKSVLEVGKDTKGNMPMSVPESMHELIEEANCIGSVTMSENLVDKVSNEITIRVSINDQVRNGVRKVRLAINRGRVRSAVK